MRIIVFGAGAIGGTIAARLALAGEEVAVVARGAHLATVIERGLLYEAPDGSRTPIRLEAAERGLAPGDAVLVTLKSYALPGAAPAIARLVAPGGLAVFLQNGLPWWYFRDLDGPFRDRLLPTLDPGGTLAAAVPRGALAGGIVSF
jgi:2-dehydropantoate 2-reductase